MIRYTRFKTILVLAPLVFGLVACSNQDEEYIQGRWQRGNVHFVDEWFFDRGAFSHQTAVANFSPEVQSGQYSLLESSEDGLTLELYDVDGAFTDERQEIRITIDRENGTLKIGREIYTRLAP
jgi:hypothetical protein